MTRISLPASASEPRVYECPRCGGKRWGHSRDFETPHSPHYRGTALVDCIGERVFFLAIGDHTCGVTERIAVGRDRL